MVLQFHHNQTTVAWGLVMEIWPFKKLEATINVDIQFSFRNVHYKTVSVPLGTHRLDEKEMTITKAT